MMNLEEKLNQINKLAGGTDHVNGSLIDHLQGTFKLLQNWGAEEFLCTAGLFHAVYGTAEFNEVLVSEEQRSQVREMIGEQAEKIVYTYCACDREFFWPQIGVDKNPLFLDRFSGKKFHLSHEELAWFCELTVANELEIAEHDTQFMRLRKKTISELFDRMKLYISPNAKKAMLEVFRPGEAESL